MSGHPHPQSILLVRLDHIGDFLVTVPALIDAIAEVHPEIDISVLTTSRSADLIRSHPKLKSVLIYDAPWSVLKDDLTPVTRNQYILRSAEFFVSALTGRRGHFDAVFHLSFSAMEKFLCVPLAPIRVGFSGPYTSPLHQRAVRCLTHSMPFTVTDHVLSNCRDLVSTIFELPRPDIFSTLPTACVPHRAGQTRLQALGITGPVICIHPGGEGSFKNWPLESFGQLAESLVKETGLPCILVGGPQQDASIRLILGKVTTRMIHPLITNGFADLAGIMSCASLIIANDGGPAHLAAALGIPTLVLFGPTDERIYAPRGPHVRTLRSDVSETRLDYPWSPGPRIHPSPSLEALHVSTVLRAALSMPSGVTHPSSVPTP